MSGLRHPTISGVRCAAVATLLVCCAALAQPPRPILDAAAQPPRPGLDGQGRTTLYLVLRTGPDVTKDEILSNLRTGMSKTGVRIEGDPNIRSINPGFAEELMALTEGATGAAVEDPKEGVAIRMLPSVARNAYELRIPARQTLKSLKVTYEKAKPKEYAPSDPGATSGLVMIVPGRYAFYPDSPEPEDYPVSYEGTVSAFGKPDAEIKGDWVKGDKYYMVTMREFQGDRDALFRAIQDKRIVADPFKGVELKNDLIFAFARLRAGDVRARPSVVDKDNNIDIRIESLEDRAPARVWIYFPLDEKSMIEARDTLRKKSGVDLSAEIRKNAVPATQASLVNSKDGPKWYELPPRPTPEGILPSEFERKIKLDDLGGLVDKYPKAYKLVVWEFDDKVNPPQAILVTTKVGNKQVRYPLQEQEMPGWVAELQEAIKRNMNKQP